MSEEQKVSIVSKYQQELDQAHNEFFAKIKDSEDLENILERMLALHALEIEKAVLVDLFNHHEVPEWILRRMLNKLESQIERVEDGKTQIKECYYHKIARDTLIVAIEEFLDNFRKKRNMNEEKYFKSRARVIILEKVLRRFEIFESVEEIAESHAFADIIERYKYLLESAKKIRQELLQKEEIQELEKNIIIGMLQIRQSDVVGYLSRAGLISHKTGKELLLTYENTLQ